MKKTTRSLLIAALYTSLVACSNETVVSFNQDVKPIFENNCFPCHQGGGEGELASGLNLETYEGLMRGTKFGPVIKSGQNFASTLQLLIEHKASETINMPKGKHPLTKGETKVIGKWIDQGTRNN